MSTHPLIELDEGAIEDIASRLELRVPNREGLDHIAKAFAKSEGTSIDVVVDLATAVGKTYLAGGLIEYLAGAGVRNFVIVVPGRTILTKTVNNFTPGHPKAIRGMETNPLVITAENFNTGSIGTALHDPNTVKLYIFTVQSLIRPNDKVTRKTRQTQEWLGEDLYQFLRAQDDLVVIADECHIYAERAKNFHEAIENLDAMATIGLTATPAPSDEGKVIYRYELARAIADRLVKTPVLVGRRDDRSDIETQLRDGMLLLEAKRKAIEAYSEATGAAPVNPVLFVVADTIDKANLVHETLRKPGLFPDNYDEAVLVVTSESPDDSLVRLDAVEVPDSPVRVIVSVSMLKEGWDVKNIFVICSLRPSISQVLTEQTLGRGLRLPWGQYTGVELLDTVEVLSHERYHELLSRAGVLLEGLLQKRVEPKVTPVPPPHFAPPPNAGTGDEAGTVVVTPEQPELFGSAGSDNGSAGEDLPDGETGVVVASFVDRLKDAQDQATEIDTNVNVRADASLHIPRVNRTVTAKSFSLSDVANDEFVAVGRQLAALGDVTLARKVLDVQKDLHGGYQLVPRESGEVITAAAPSLPLGGAKKLLRDAICQLSFVPEDGLNIRAAERLADAVVEGAGSEEALASYLGAVTNAATRIVRDHFRRTPDTETIAVEDSEFLPTRVNSRPRDPNHFGEFSRKTAYVGWRRALFDVDWFDSRPERDLANILDEDPDVEVWTRIQRGELTIEWEGGRYSPDFAVRTSSRSYLFEVKADRDLELQDVQAKRATAERWARRITDEGRWGTWTYVLVPESVTNTAKTLAAVVQQARS